MQCQTIRIDSEKMASYLKTGKKRSPSDNQSYLLGLNGADTADRDGCDTGFWGFAFRSEVAASWPFLRIETFPSFRMIPGPSLPRVSDGAHASNGGGPWRQLDGA